MKKSFSLLLAMVSLLTASCATMTPKSETRSYLLKMNVSGESIQPRQLADDIKDVLAKRSSSMTVDMRFMPEVIPASPAGGIVMKPMNFGPVSVAFLQCAEGSIANIASGRTGSGGLGQSDSEQYTACIFPFAPEGKGKQFRLVVGFRYTESSSGGLSGMIASGINSAFASGMGKEEMGQVFFQQIEDGLMTKYPDAKVVDKQSL